MTTGSHIQVPKWHKLTNIFFLVRVFPFEKTHSLCANHELPVRVTIILTNVEELLTRPTWLGFSSASYMGRHKRSRARTSHCFASVARWTQIFHTSSLIPRYPHITRWISLIPRISFFFATLVVISSELYKQLQERVIYRRYTYR